MRISGIWVMVVFAAMQMLVQSSLSHVECLLEHGDILVWAADEDHVWSLLIAMDPCCHQNLDGCLECGPPPRPMLVSEGLAVAGAIEFSAACTAT